ncbi:hypothetical protein T265_06440 [Opisthorchis viverrini]|uniref:Uncharacterized protein n=1 Tax=Opisthorchis viverrini TaxID=6198 RepID=A0A074ZKF9_OPIVI|nr:hypothetical protein T265_06440 [Opisthorchis viverrini]KER26242.1 hypothetical protein T265_06440 [Opisthorchis viverrini]
MEIDVCLDPRTHDSFDSTVSRSHKHKSSICRRFVFAVVHLTHQKLNPTELDTRLNPPTPLQLCFAMRRSIDSSIIDNYGDLSGARILSYDLLLCRKNPATDTHLKTQDLTWSLVLSVPGPHIPQLLSSLSFMTTQGGGDELLGLLLDSTGLSKSDCILYVDVIGVYRTLFELPLDHFVEKKPLKAD